MILDILKHLWPSQVTFQREVWDIDDLSEREIWDSVALGSQLKLRP